jgi:hypothetical protein
VRRSDVMRPQIEQELLIKNGGVLETKEILDASVPPLFTRLNSRHIVRRQESKWAPVTCLSRYARNGSRLGRIADCPLLEQTPSLGVETSHATDTNDGWFYDSITGCHNRAGIAAS